MCRLAVAGRNTQRPLARPENYCESKQTYFTYSLDKVYHLPEIQGKLFITQNGVGGFPDILLKALFITLCRSLVTKLWFAAAAIIARPLNRGFAPLGQKHHLAR